ncbi:MAG: HD domain-containing protein, partial [Gemmatimonadetes bacterium]|nr:HD domain-containing protein [Gemmatimonadota bacterium]
RLDLLYALLLKDAGCSANASRVYQLFGGPEHEVKRAVWVRDWRKFTQQAAYALAFAGRGFGFTARLKKLARLARLGPRASRELFQLRCARGAEIANLMELGADVAAAIRSMDEHWDGGGHPEGIAGDSIPLYAQIIGLAQVMEIYWGIGGPQEAVRVAHRRSGTWFNPKLTRVLSTRGRDGALWRRLETADEVTGSSPLLAPARAVHDGPLDDAGMDRIASAYAMIIDGKSPFTADHSRRVSQYASALARRLELTEAEISRIQRAALVHDLGKLAVPNSILEKPGSLEDHEWDRIREHPAVTHDILRRTPGFAELAFDAANHHEHVDGTGYHLGVGGEDLSLSARVLAVSDVLDALAADRPYRTGMEPETVMSIIEEGAGTHFCTQCVDACSADLVANLAEVPAAAHPSARTSPPV